MKLSSGKLDYPTMALAPNYKRYFCTIWLKIIFSLFSSKKEKKKILTFNKENTFNQTMIEMINMAFWQQCVYSKHSCLDIAFKVSLLWVFL